jgi:2-methylcitrate dehydratase PrpD
MSIDKDTNVIFGVNIERADYTDQNVRDSLGYIMEIGATQKIADFVNNIDYGSIPQEAINIAKNGIRDCIGVAVAGANEPIAKILTKYAKEIGAKGEAGVICGGFKTTVDLAAWVNGAIGHDLDYDDSFPNLIGFNFHPTVVTLPPVLTLAEKHELSGKDLLTAYICGVEIEFVLGEGIGKYISELGWHPTPIIGVIGAAVASAKILKLNASETKMAIGIASSLAGGLMRNTGSMTKPMHAGYAARNGVIAAQLTKSGFTSNQNILEERFGFCDLFSGSRVSSLTDQVQRLGQDWKIISKGISFKPYPCCRGSHSSIDAALYLREKYKIHPDDIETVTCRTSPSIPQLLPFHRPQKGSEGKFSLEYCVATSFLRGKPRIEDFSDERVNDPKVQTLLSKVNYLHPEGWVEGPDLMQEVAIKLKNGEQYSCKVSLPKGEPENPMTNDELMEKFRNCVEEVLPKAKSEYVSQMVNNLHSFDNIFNLMDILTYEVKEGQQRKDLYQTQGGMRD